MASVKIMIASDLSENSLTIIEEGFRLARHLNGEVLLTHVVDNTSQYSEYYPGMPKVWNWEEIKEHAKNSLTKLAHQFNDIECKVMIGIGDPKKELVELTRSLNATYFVVGTHGKTGIPHWIMGSNAEYLIRHTTVPVVVIPLNKDIH